jgi:hypothetical protein
MAYDVIGNVTDQENKPIVGLIVDDGSQGVPTNSDGYYEIKTNKNILNFRIIGFKPQTFDLKKYKDGSAVNVDITMQEDENVTTQKPLEIVASRVTIKPPVKTPTSPLKVGLGVGFGAGLIAFLIAKYKLKSVPLIAGITIGTFVISGALGYTFQNKKNNKL